MTLIVLKSRKTINQSINQSNSLQHYLSGKNCIMEDVGACPTDVTEFDSLPTSSSFAVYASWFRLVPL